MNSTNLSIITVILIALISIVYMGCSTFGARSKGASLEKINKSANFKNGKFYNIEKTRMMINDASKLSITLEFIKGGKERTPESEIKTEKFNKKDFLSKKKGIQTVWFGHSTVLMNVDGKIILTDPVFSKRASPVPFVAGKPFKYSHITKTEDLPHIDIVFISHDHYDHLDIDTIKKISDRVTTFMVPLGVAAHLKLWGVPEKKIVEMDWWETYTPAKNIKFTATPARHFSGRGLFDKDETLWCSWVIKINGHNIYYGGDSGYGKHFKLIGDRFGPFDFVMLECGQYNKDWPDIHMMPEETIRAYNDLNSKMMMPIHWGKYELSLHTWREPMERLFTEADNRNVNIVTPVIGNIVKVEKGLVTARWWKKEKKSVALEMNMPIQENN